MPRIQLIATVGSNHGGNVSLAREFIHRFAAVGADFVKFDLTRVAHLSITDPEFARYSRCELVESEYAALAEECHAAGVQFLATVHHAADVRPLRAIADTVYVDAHESGNRVLVETIFAANFATILVENPPKDRWIKPMNRGYKKPRVLPLSTNLRVPCPVGAVRLEPGVWGWADRCYGLDGAITAIALGARLIDKTVQLPLQPGASWDATLDQFRTLRAYADIDTSPRSSRWQHTTAAVGVLA